MVRASYFNYPGYWVFKPSMTEQQKKNARKNGKLGGRPKGSKSLKTLEKDRVRAMYNQKVLTVAERLFSSQLHLAVGQTFLYKIEKETIVGPKGGVSYKAKPPKLVEDPSEMELYLMGLVDEDEIETGPAATYYFLTAKEPSKGAIADMLDRALDKASQPLKGDKDNPIEVNVNQITIKRYAKPASKPRGK